MTEPKGHIEIYSQRFSLIVDDAGIEHVKVKDLCEPFGIDARAQQQRLERLPWAMSCKITGLRSNGRKHVFSCIPLRRVPMFFATLSPGHFGEEHRDAIVAMQVEAADAVAAYYIDGGTINPRASRSQLEQFAETLASYFRDEPTSEPIWPDAFVRRYAEWHGTIWKPGSRHPFSMRSANWFLYTMIFPSQVLEVIRSKGLAEGVRYHQMLTDAPRNYLAAKLELAAGIAEACRTEKQWRQTMARIHGKSVDDGSLEMFE